MSAVPYTSGFLFRFAVFFWNPSILMIHNIHALDRLIKLDQKEKSGLFASVGKQFFTQLGKAAKLITPKNKD